MFHAEVLNVSGCKSLSAKNSAYGRRQVGVNEKTPPLIFDGHPSRSVHYSSARPLLGASTFSVIFSD
jgi:hypothetical protein